MTYVTRSLLNIRIVRANVCIVDIVMLCVIHVFTILLIGNQDVHALQMNGCGTSLLQMYTSCKWDLKKCSQSFASKYTRVLVSVTKEYFLKKGRHSPWVYPIQKLLPHRWPWRHHSAIQVLRRKSPLTSRMVCWPVIMPRNEVRIFRTERNSCVWIRVDTLSSEMSFFQESEALYFSWMMIFATGCSEPGLERLIVPATTLMLLGVRLWEKWTPNNYFFGETNFFLLED